MKITDVRIRKVAKEGKMKAVVSITIDGEFVVHDIKVIEGEKGMFIAMPSSVLLMESTEILHIRSVLQPATVSRQRFLKNIRKFWKSRQNKNFPRSVRSRVFCVQALKYWVVWGRM